MCSSSIGRYVPDLSIGGLGNLAGALEPRRRLPYLPMPPSKLSPFSSFCFRVRTLLSTCFAGFFLIGCFGARGGVMKSEETVRGRLGSVIIGVGVQGEASSLGSSLSSCLISCLYFCLTSCWSSCLIVMSFFAAFFRGTGVLISDAGTGLGVGALGSQHNQRLYCFRPSMTFL